jgi:hypothetical protein
MYCIQGRTKKGKERCLWPEQNSWEGAKIKNLMLKIITVTVLLFTKISSSFILIKTIYKNYNIFK